MIDAFHQVVGHPDPVTGVHEVTTQLRMEFSPGERDHLHIVLVLLHVR